MQTHVDFASIGALFERAASEGRWALCEYEVYDLIRFSGSETPPAYLVLNKNDRLEREEVENFPGEKVVVKIVSPLILHKSDVGGVRIVGKSVPEILSTVRAMYYDIPPRFVEVVRRGKYELSPELVGFDDEELERRIAESITGVVLCQYMHPDSQEFGNELLVSLRRTREFGMILSAGLGGTDTELYASRFKKGQAVVAASTMMVSGRRFFELFQQTISYKKLAGLTRGQKRIVTDEQLLECFLALIEVGNHFSPGNPDAAFVIDELEINPFAFSSYLMLPLDGLCRFSRRVENVQPRPVEGINSLLHPQTVAIAGVSSRGMNIGRIILENILKMGFAREKITLIHPSAKTLAGIDTVAGLKEMEKVDLCILAVSAGIVADLAEQVVAEELADAVILVPGGYGEEQQGVKRQRALQIRLAGKRRLAQSAPLFLGGNSLGVLSHPGQYDALFIPESKLPKSRGQYLRRSALVSQSGAYMITRMSKLSFLDPAYAVSIGNQIDLTAGDFLHYFKNIETLETVAFYMEGFADLDGLRFTAAVADASRAGKEIIFYKAGRTEEGKTALSGHTASIAGDYMVCESCISQAGAFVAETFSDFEGLLRLSRALYHKDIAGNRLAAVSNAGYEAVGIADNILGEDYSLTMARYSREAEEQLAATIEDAGLSSLVAITNPMDVTPMATEQVYADVIRSLLSDDGVDLIIIAIVPLTPILHTLPEEHIKDDSLSDDKGIVATIADLKASSQKPLVIVVDSGPLYDHLADGLESQGLPVFRSADQAVRVLGKYVHVRLFLKKRLRSHNI